MLAIDTNVIVRYLTGDHPEQSARAKALIESEETFVATTVLLETEWVLLRAFAGLPRVTLEAPAIAARALDWTEHGMDFADALHLASAAECGALVTSDARFARTAARMGAAHVRDL